MGGYKKTVRQASTQWFIYTLLSIGNTSSIQKLVIDFTVTG